MRDRRALIPSTDDLVIISHISHHRPLCVQLHKRINKRTRINSRPVASRRGREQGGIQSGSECDSVSVLLQHVSACIFLSCFALLILTTSQRGGRDILFFFPLKNCPIMSLHYPLVGWNMDMSPWRSPYLVFVYMLSCAKAFPSSGITTISSLSWPCTPSWTFGHTLHF